MFSDDELLGLPDDPRLAFAAFDEKLRSNIAKQLQDVALNRFNAIDQLVAEKYILTIEAYIDVNEVNVELPTIEYGSDESFSETVKEFISCIDKFSVKSQLTYFKQMRDGSINAVNLKLGEKTKIHEHLNRIKAIIEESGLADNKKNGLLAKVNALAIEVDRTGTRTDAFLGLYLDACMALGRGAEYAKPFLDEVKFLIGIIARAKARDEGIALPSADQAPLIGRD